MGASFVRATKIEASTGTTVSGTIPAPASGNALLVVGAQYQGTGSSATCADNKGNTYTAVANRRAGQIQDGNAWANSWIAANVTNGPTSVTVTVGSGASGGTYEVIEISGAATASPVDVSAVASATSNTEASGTISAKAGDCVVAWTADDQTTNPATLTAPGSPWTTDGTELNAATYQDLSVVYQSNVSAGSYSATWTASGSPKSATIIVGILAAAGGTSATISPTSAWSSQASLVQMALSSGQTILPTLPAGGTMAVTPGLALGAGAAASLSLESSLLVAPVLALGTAVTVLESGGRIPNLVPASIVGTTLLPTSAEAGLFGTIPTVSGGGGTGISPASLLASCLSLGPATAIGALLAPAIFPATACPTAPAVAGNAGLALLAGAAVGRTETGSPLLASGTTLQLAGAGAREVLTTPVLVVGAGVLLGPLAPCGHGTVSTPIVSVGVGVLLALAAGPARAISPGAALGTTWSVLLFPLGGGGTVSTVLPIVVGTGAVPLVVFLFSPREIARAFPSRLLQRAFPQRTLIFQFPMEDA